ncbi:MAG: ABC transporter ATP-binding protein [Phycisphaerae bacterium]
MTAIDTPPPAITCDGLTKAYARHTVLNALHLAIPAGSVTGLLGKNGAGKTTLLKCLLGLIRPDSGSLRLLNENPASLSADAKSRLGYVPQTPSLYHWMRIRQLLDYTAAFYPRWNADLVDALMKRFELKPDAKVGTLSVGTAQKLAIILALAHEPELLLLDEPAASLDPIARREFLSAILDIAVDGRRTVLFSTHITSDLERVADSVAILKNGRILYHDALDYLKDSIKRLHVSAPNPLPASLPIPGRLDNRPLGGGGEACLTIRGNVPQTIAQLERDFNATVRVEDLNLEDILLEMDHA